MEIKITVYKESGKYYTDTIAKSETDIPMFKQEFKKFVIDNLPAKLRNGYVIVEDVDIEKQSFHQGLYKIDELYLDVFL